MLYGVALKVSRAVLLSFFRVILCVIKQGSDNKAFL